MIDLHCHMLPSVDDGAKTISMALDMAREAEAEGINKILLTPHHMDGEYINHRKDTEIAVENLQKTFNDNNIGIELRPGQEVHINGDLLKDIDEDDVLYADGTNKKYMMLEFPHSGVPEYAEDMIFELKVKGIIPIIVHPERNHSIQQDPDILFDLVSQGCLTQITATSYVGGFGSTIQRFTDKIVDSGLGFMFSSDAHNMEGRRFRMKEAFDRLAEKKGKDVALQYEKNAEKVWNGETIEIGNIDRVKKESTASKFFKKLLGK
ncbi:tyrosine protein phosphatase [Apilactobacillus kunkeei]|uniref:tyrosine-protein phosphatase n=1 Tax=Apilactobacillus kunkeei TaxID=148814 RepID=UPI00059AC96D|nr:CpsB/CapC family capsule biosynthesis tyrosine phosphatase [Apilactobacillus kunkeei]KIM18158.1 tyrosine protein phosphatase [Apilactobacillus kunkeei]